MKSQPLSSLFSSIEFCRHSNLSGRLCWNPSNTKWQSNLVDGRRLSMRALLKQNGSSALHMPLSAHDTVVSPMSRKPQWKLKDTTLCSTRRHCSRPQSKTSDSCSIENKKPATWMFSNYLSYRLWKLKLSYVDILHQRHARLWQNRMFSFVVVSRDDSWTQLLCCMDTIKRPQSTAERKLSTENSQLVSIPGGSRLWRGRGWKQGAESMTRSRRDVTTEAIEGKDVNGVAIFN